MCDLFMFVMVIVCMFKKKNVIACLVRSVCLELKDNGFESWLVFCCNIL